MGEGQAFMNFNPSVHIKFCEDLRKITSCLQQGAGKSNLSNIFSEFSVPGPKETVFQSLID